MFHGDRVGLIYSKRYVLRNVDRTKLGFSVLPLRNVWGKKFVVKSNLSKI